MTSLSRVKQVPATYVHGDFKSRHALEQSPKITFPAGQSVIQLVFNF